jgi:hypothetical protein
LTKAFSGAGGRLAGRTLPPRAAQAGRPAAGRSGCSASEIQAILGHADLKTAQIYVDAANKDKLAKQAMGVCDAVAAFAHPTGWAKTNGRDEPRPFSQKR